MTKPPSTNTKLNLLRISSISLGVAAVAIGALDEQSLAQSRDARDSLPVYQITSNGLSAKEASIIKTGLRRFSGSRGRYSLQNDGRLSYINYQSLIHGTKAGPPIESHGSSDKENLGKKSPSSTWDLQVLKASRAPSPASLSQYLNKSLSSLSLGDNRTSYSSAFVRLQISKPDSSRPVFSANTGTTAERQSFLGSIPLVGPGHSLDLWFGADGSLGHLSASLKQLKKTRNRVVTPQGKEANLACAAAIDRKNKYQSRIVYYIALDAKKGDLVKPVLECKGSPVGGSLQRIQYVDATGKSPFVLNGTSNRKTADRGAKSGDGIGEFGSAYLGANARGPLVGANGSAPNTNGFRASISRLWSSVINRVDSAPSSLFTGGSSAPVNNVDLMWYTGHANGTSWQANSGSTRASDVQLGQVDLEWLVIAACGPLQEVVNGTPWNLRLGRMFEGMHQLLAYATVSNADADEGRIFANYARGRFFPGITFRNFPIRLAWAIAATTVQPSSVEWAVMGTISPDLSRGTVNDCLNCNLGDQYASRGTWVWRWSGNS